MSHRLTDEARSREQGHLGHELPPALPDVSPLEVRAENSPNTGPFQTKDSESGGKSRSVAGYLRGVPTTYRAKVRQLYRQRGGFQDDRFNDPKREVLAECVFEVVNDLEHRYAERSDISPVAVALLETMNRIYDDIGWNE